MSDAFICDAVRTPVGRYGGGLSKVRTDDLGAVPIKALMDRNEGVDWGQVDDVYFGSANQAGEDNRNVARMSGLLAGLPIEVGGATVNRLCGSGMEATAQGADGTAAAAEPAMLVAETTLYHQAVNSSTDWGSAQLAMITLSTILVDVFSDIIYTSS